MFTGLYKTAMERFENVVINTSVTVFIVLLVLKLTGLAELTYLEVALPFIIPTVTLVVFVALARLFDYLADVLATLSIKMKRLIRRNG
jgi:hypothetical protein